MSAARHARLVIAALLATQGAWAGAQQNARAPTAFSLNCNDPAVSKSDGAWHPSNEQMQALGTKLSKVFPIVANSAGVPKTHYGMLYCGIRADGASVIVADGVRKYHGKYICDDEANFAVAFDPDKKSFGTFHFAAHLCPPPGESKPAQ